jgi:hypothetical protein
MRIIFVSTRALCQASPEESAPTNVFRIGASSQALTRLAGSPPRSYSVEELSKQINIKLEVIRGVLQEEAEQVLAAYQWPKW